MYEYKAVADIPPRDLTVVTTTNQEDGWQVEKMDFYLTNDNWRYAIVFKRYLHGPEGLSTAEVETNRVRDKLRAVRDALVPVMGALDNDGRKVAVGRILADIDNFFFGGSPEDM